jgi:fatty-acyl-CoA synthase
VPSTDLNLAQVHELVAAEVPGRDCIVAGERRLSYAAVTERTRRLANFLRERGIGCHRERSELQPWETGQDFVALYLYNGAEYLEGMLASYKARAAPFNVNYRYVEKELEYLFRDARARAVIFHSEFARQVDSLRRSQPGLEVLIQVPDASGEKLLPGALWYDDALAKGSPERPALAWSPDDLYVVYTGGTTGMPKAVLWRQADILVSAMGGRRPDGGENTLLDYRSRAKKGGRGFLVAPPLMHGAAQWVAFNQFHAGNTVVMPRETRRLDADDLWRTAERERVVGVVLVGDAFARPLLDQLERAQYELASLGSIFSGGAVLSARSKQAFLDALPGVRIVDVVGSSETGSQGEAVTQPGERAQTGGFGLRKGACVLSDDLTRELVPGDPEIGWLAQTGRVPLGYLGDPDKTRRTFPSIGGRRFSVPGDRARRSADGGIELLGRESVTINSGGEKIFSEEVELALKQHPAVYDAIVCDRPSERWGKEVVAVVRVREGMSVTTRELLDECGRHLAKYKWPRAFAFRAEIARSPSGKPDYAWARAQATAADVVEA